MYSVCYCRVIILSRVRNFNNSTLFLLCYHIALVLKLIASETINVRFVVNTRKNYGPLQQLTMHRIIYVLLNLE